MKINFNIKVIWFLSFFIFLIIISSFFFLEKNSKTLAEVNLTNEKLISDFFKEEVLSQRDAYTKIFKIKDYSNSRGYRLIAERSAEKIHYKSGNRWKEVNNNIIKKKNGNFEYQNKANDFKIYFGNNVQDGFRFLGEGLDLTVGQIILNNGEMIIKNSVAEISNNTIVYKNILPDIDLKYTVFSDGISKQIILKNKNALNNNLSKIEFEIKKINRIFTKEGGLKGKIKFEGLNNIDFIDPKTFDNDGTEVQEEEVLIEKKDLKINKSKGGSGDSIVIKPNLNFLNSNNRQFPIIIDPGIQVKDPWQDTFVSTSTKWTPQGGWSPTKPLFVGKYYDPVPKATYWSSRVFLKFPGISQHVIWAKLRVYQYGSTGGNNGADVKKINDFNEQTLIWPGTNMSGWYGNISFDSMVQQNSTRMKESSDISGLVNQQIGSGKVLIGLQSWTENSKGSVFCSKDWASGHCQGKAPKLIYEINYPPYPVKPDFPDNNMEFIGNCDMSVTPVSGNCSGYENIDYKVSNIGDGEKPVTDFSNKTRVKIQMSSDNNNFSDLTEYKPESYVNNSYEFNDIKTPDGKYYWRGVAKEWLSSGQTATSLDLPQGPESTSTKYILVDTTPPTIPELEPLPEFTPGNQIEIFIKTKSTDNVASKDEITYYLQVSTDLRFQDDSQLIFEGIMANSEGLVSFQVPNLEDNKKYYYRIKAKDRKNNNPNGNISGWSSVVSSIQDNSLPIVKSLNIDNERFSPSNETSKKIKDTVIIKAEIREKNFKNAKLEIRNSNDNLIRTINSCRLNFDDNNYDLSSGCNANNVNFPSSFQSGFLIFEWDGKRDDLNYALDGLYKIQLVVEDKAFQNNNLNLSVSNKIVILDDTGANIGIISPKNNYWTNESEIVFNGAVAGFNKDNKEDKDFQSLRFLDENQQINKDITEYVDDNNNFNYKSQLSLGKNIFRFKTVDSVGNVVDKIGDPGDEQVQNWIVNQEKTNPEIIKIKPFGILKDGSDNINPKVNFTIKDESLNQDLSKISDLNIGLNPKGYDISLIRNLCMSGTNLSCNLAKNEIPLFIDGKNVTSGNLADNFVCSQIGEKGSEINCEFQLNNLQPDSSYEIFLRIKDRAGNKTCNINQSLIINNDIGCDPMSFPVKDKIENLEAEFEVDSHTFLSLEKPIKGEVYNHKDVIFEGKGEKKSKIKIENDILKRYVDFSIKESSNNILPAEYMLDGTLVAKEGEFSQDRILTTNKDFVEIECGFYEDIDNNEVTPDIEVCDFNLKLNNADNFAGLQSELIPDAVINTNKIILTDQANNSLFEDLDLKIDLYSIEISSKPNLKMISPNGDGRQDGIVFENTVKNKNNQEDKTRIKSYELKIFNKKNEIVRKFANNSELPNIINWDGKDLTGNWIEDGEYNFILEIITTDNVKIATLPQTIKAVGNLNDEVVITSPKDGYVTTRGVINVQGQAPIGSKINENLNELTFLRDKTFVEVCVDTILDPNIVSCDHLQTVEVDENGFWSTILVLPMPEKGIRKHYITAVAKDIAKAR